MSRIAPERPLPTVSDPMKISTLQEKKLDELREIARELDLSGYSDLRKQDLIYRILEAQAEGAASDEEEAQQPSGDAEALGGLLEHPPHPPVARLGDDQPLGAMDVNVFHQHLGERVTAVVGSSAGHLGVDHRPPEAALMIAEVAHGGQKHRDPQLVAPDMLGLLAHLRHPERIAVGVEAVQRAAASIQLIPEHQHHVAKRGHIRIIPRPSRRNPSPVARSPTDQLIH